MTKRDNGKFSGFVLAVVTTLSASGVIALFNLAMTVVRLDEKLRNFDCDKPRPKRAAQAPAERRPTVLSAMGFGFLQRFFLHDRKGPNESRP